MKSQILFLTVISVTTILFNLTSCSSGKQYPIEQRLQQTLDRKIQKYKVRGVSAAVIFPDQKVWNGTSGISHNAVPIKPDMLFAIGSITKNFVAALILKLAEEGALSLSDPLSRWLPAYPHVDSTITIRQLLNHTSGIFMFWDNQKLWDDLKKYRDSVFTPEVVMTYLKEPYFAPGKGWRYSNTNYLLLAKIATRATHSILSAELRKRFWQPLFLTNTYLSMEEEIPDRLAHVWGDNFENDGSDRDLTYLPRASHESITYGSSGIFTTAEELARWCHALFEGEVLQQQTMDEMLEFVDIGFGSKKRGYGLGVELFMKRISSGEKAIGHSGANIGTSVYMVHLPDHHVSVVVMINSMNHECSEAITKDLITIVLRELKVIGIIPYFEFSLSGFIVMGSTIIILINVILYIRRRRKSLRVRSFRQRRIPPKAERSTES